jgi:hypothetical protein
MIDSDDAHHAVLPFYGSLNNYNGRCALDTVQRCCSRLVAGWVPAAYVDVMSDQQKTEPAVSQDEAKRPPPKPMPKEIGGPKGPEPTRYGDWEVNGRCVDF